MEGKSERMERVCNRASLPRVSGTARFIVDTVLEKGVVDIVVEKIEDIKDIMGYVVMSIPGVVINENVVHAGGIHDRKTVERGFP